MFYIFSSQNYPYQFFFQKYPLTHHLCQVFVTCPILKSNYPNLVSLHLNYSYAQAQALKKKKLKNQLTNLS